MFTKSSYKDLPTQHLSGTDFGTNGLTGVKQPSVSSMLSPLPRASQKGMAQEAMVDFILAHAQDIAERAQRDPEGLKADLLAAPKRQREAVMQRGQRAHEAFETIALGETPTGLTGDIRELALHFWHFVKHMKIEFLHAELPVWSEEAAYCGVIDAIGIPRSQAAGDLQDKVLVFDWKTGTPDPQVALQLAAYAAASYGIRGGQRIELPAIDAAAVVKISTRGWSMQQVEIGEVNVAPEGSSEPVNVDIFGYMRALREVLDWSHLVQHRVLHDPVAAGAFSTYVAGQDGNVS